MKDIDPPPLNITILLFFFFFSLLMFLSSSLGISLTIYQIFEYQFFVSNRLINSYMIFDGLAIYHSNKNKQSLFSTSNLFHEKKKKKSKTYYYFHPLSRGTRVHFCVVYNYHVSKQLYQKI